MFPLTNQTFKIAPTPPLHKINKLMQFSKTNICASRIVRLLVCLLMVGTSETKKRLVSGLREPVEI